MDTVTLSYSSLVKQSEDRATELLRTARKKIDEIFGSLDEERRGAVVELLRSLADRFPQVILITHIDSVRDGFDRIIRVSFDPRRGVASAEEERRHGDVAA